MALLEGRLANGDTGVAQLDERRQLLSHLSVGQYYDQVIKGNVYIYHIASQAIVVAGNGVPTVINQHGSGVNFVPLSLRLSWTSGTTTIGSVVIGALKKVSAIATGAGSPILTATQVAPENALVGHGKVGRTLWSPTTNTFTAAPTVIAAAGINVGPVDPVSGYMAEAKFDGSLVFAPGTAMSICYSVATSTALFHMTIIGLEVPVV